jgi:peptidoglycan/xylan/chitin deacetylase (PgdA/CDA1 family)
VVVARDAADSVVRAIVQRGAAVLALCLCAVLSLGSAPARAAAEPPPVIPRAGWGADESLRFNAAGAEIWPRMFWPVQKIVVHHTETQNYDPDPAGTIRAIYRDDVRRQGLGDIAYNFLIDERGRIYEGRYSRQYAAGERPTGEDQLGNGVAAAHAFGFNSGTVGIALLGSFTQIGPTARARNALERLVAWIAARHHIDPAGATLYRNPATGAQQVFANVAGHGEINETDCPGLRVREALPGIRANAAALLAGGPVPPAAGLRPARPKHRASRVQKRENRAIDRVRRRHPVVYSGGGRRREVALVFHDGPGPHTPQVVDTLRRLRAAATFFDIGDEFIYFSEAAAAAHRAGFPIGNLTQTFPPLTRLSRARQRREVRAQTARLRSLGIPSPKLFAPPYGTYNRKTLAVLRRLRMLMVLWSADTRDYERPGVTAIVRRALRGAKPGAIILLHDGGGDRTQTVQALPAIVSGLRSRGYKLVTVPRMMLKDPPRP